MKPWIGDPVRPDGSPEVCSECDRRAFLRVRVADSAPPPAALFAAPDGRVALGARAARSPQAEGRAVIERVRGCFTFGPWLYMLADLARRSPW